MVTGALPASATDPDIETLVFKYSSGLPPTLADYATILRCYLREVCSAFADFLAICDEGLLKDVAQGLLSDDTALHANIYGTGISLSISQPRPPLVQFFIAQTGAYSAAVVGLTYANGSAVLEMWGEIAFFEAMAHNGIPAHQALWVVHNALYCRAAEKQDGEVARLASRLKQLGTKVEQALTRRGIPWGTRT